MVSKMRPRRDFHFGSREIETETETLTLGLVKSRPVPRLYYEVSRDRDFYKTGHFKSRMYRDHYRDQKSLGTEGLDTETAHLCNAPYAPYAAYATYAQYAPYSQLYTTIHHNTP